jgi:hypothetical protein
MNIEDVISLASTSELSSLAVKDDSAAILDYVNLGLIELYKRFPVSVKEQVIALLDNTDTYSMPEDFMWVVAAYGEVQEGSSVTVNTLPINEEDNPLSINMINWYQVQVPMSMTGAYISIIYTAAPRMYYTADLAEVVPIPPQLVEALLHYVGYRAHAAITGDIKEENNTHYQRFEASCKRVETKGMFTSDDVNMDSRIVNRGFA